MSRIVFRGQCGAKYGLGDTCEIHEERYTNGRTALQVWGFSKEGFPEPLLKATVNLPDMILQPDEILIKSYAENEGVLEWLESIGLVKQIGTVFVNHSEAAVCKYTPPEGI